MTLSAEDRNTLIDLLRDLRPGHVSTVVASLSEPGSQIGTSTDSENHVFLQKLCECGLAKEVPLDLDMGPEPPAVTSFSVNDDAKAEIAELLRAASSSTGRQT